MIIVHIPANPITLVYNCANVPALCANVAQYTASGGTITTFHYDTYTEKSNKIYDGKDRRQARRDLVCPSKTWKYTVRVTDQGPRSASSLRCPEKNQPNFKISSDRGIISYPPLLAAQGDVWRSPMGRDNRLYLKSVPDSYRDGQNVQHLLKNYPFDLKLTCDEFPPAMSDTLFSFRCQISIVL